MLLSLHCLQPLQSGVLLVVLVVPGAAPQGQGRGQGQAWGWWVGPGREMVFPLALLPGGIGGVGVVVAVVGHCLQGLQKGGLLVVVVVLETAPLHPRKHNS